MDNIQSFDVLAEISIALIGFAGVVVALGRSSLPREALRFRLVLLFVNGATALWGGLTPAIASMFVLESTTVPLLAGTLYLPALIGVNGYAWVQFVSLIRRRQVLPRAFYFVTPPVMASLLYLIVALVWLTEHIMLAHFTSVVFMLFLGLYHFFVLTIGVLGDDHTDA